MTENFILTDWVFERFVFSCVIEKINASTRGGEGSFIARLRLGLERRLGTFDRQCQGSTVVRDLIATRRPAYQSEEVCFAVLLPSSPSLEAVETGQVAWQPLRLHKLC
jgi:hypothetical protein